MVVHDSLKSGASFERFVRIALNQAIAPIEWLQSRRASSGTERKYANKYVLESIVPPLSLR
jgi:hypothetical protein